MSVSVYPGPNVGLLDENGNPYGVKQVDGKPRVSSVPYLYDIAEGVIANHSSFRVLGYTIDIDNVERDIWEYGSIASARYVFPTVAMGLELVSTSDEDSGAGGVNPAGTGIQTVEIHYLDNTWAEQVEVIALDGTTAVTTLAVNIYRINGFHTKTTGISKMAVGAIQLRHLADTPVYSYISVGRNHALQAVYTVPLGKVAYIVGWNYSSGAVAIGHYARFILLATVNDEVWQDGVFNIKDIVLIQDGNGAHDFQSPIKLPAKTDMKVGVISDGAASNVLVSAQISGWIESV